MTRKAPARSPRTHPLFGSSRSRGSSRCSSSRSPRDGRVVYSDKRELIGARYLLEDDERMALADGRVHAGISDLSRPENRFERTERKLRDVYMPVETAGGEPLLFSQEASVQAETRPRGP